MTLNSWINIRPASSDDFEKLVDIWFEASIRAHHFIPESYWEENKVEMQNNYLPRSEVYLAEDEQQIYGFIALVENEIAAIFVAPDQQGKGIGKLLISHAKNLRPQLVLNVYQDNKNSIAFYKSEGFEVVQESFETETQSKVFVMSWIK
ncbi:MULTISPECIES: N-acetyltransferase [Acinetobacter]|uniref:N-acetyltransferase n=1 Tax=Acinetobacter TaxID=469 RepID=UPI002004DCD7|nr:N-acetyltransferase [Acinetobacter radioresistens]MCK4082086.1 N-acetyltransferase [Acinetobacter radioresistens]MCK4090231.1 N-acetyltransferase [Acinetobacter radioresistens]MCU4499982.1 N-acetyltransferase [Acinetobacter radioresistens]